MLGKTTIRNPVILWLNAASPDPLPQSGPPAAPFTVTRSEVRISRRSTAVHIWYALVPARAAAHP
jgi:hypothetical protein